MSAYGKSVIKLKKYRCYSRKSCKGQSAVLLSEPRNRFIITKSPKQGW